MFVQLIFILVLFVVFGIKLLVSYFLNLYNRVAFRTSRDEIPSIHYERSDFIEQDGIQWTPLHYAVKMGNIQEVQVLLEQGADPSSKSSDGLTPLHDAVRYDDDNTVRHRLCQLLLEYGADCDETDDNELTPFIMALATADVGVVSLLIDHGCDIEEVDEAGMPGFAYAVTNPDSRVIEHVLDQGIDIGGDVKNFCLVLAVSHCDKCSRDCMRWRTVAILLEHGADVFTMVQGKTLMETAVEERSCHVLMNILIRHLVKLEYENFKITETDRQIIRNNKCSEEFFRRCTQEIEDMKNLKFYHDISIFHVFMKSEKILAGYARNKDLVKALGDKKLKKRYPVYYASLKKRFHTVLKKHKSRVTASRVLSDILDFHDPSHPVVQKILGFLTDEDLEFLEM